MCAGVPVEDARPLAGGGWSNCGRRAQRCGRCFVEAGGHRQRFASSRPQLAAPALAAAEEAALQELPCSRVQVMPADDGTERSDPHGPRE